MLGSLPAAWLIDSDPASGNAGGFESGKKVRRGGSENRRIWREAKEVASSAGVGSELSFPKMPAICAGLPYMKRERRRHRERERKSTA